MNEYEYLPTYIIENKIVFGKKYLKRKWIFWFYEKLNIIKFVRSFNTQRNQTEQIHNLKFLEKQIQTRLNLKILNISLHIKAVKYIFIYTLKAFFGGNFQKYSIYMDFIKMFQKSNTIIYYRELATHQQCLANKKYRLFRFGSQLKC